MPFHVRLPGKNEGFYRPLELPPRLARVGLLGQHRIRHQMTCPPARQQLQLLSSLSLSSWLSFRSDEFLDTQHGGRVLVGLDFLDQLFDG